MSIIHEGIDDLAPLNGFCGIVFLWLALDAVCPYCGEKLERAVARFPFERPHEDQEARIDFMDSLEESDELFLLGDDLCGDERIWELMEEYVRKRPESFPR